MTGTWERVGRAIELLNEGDIDTFYDLLADDCVYSSPMGVVRGRQAIVESDRALLPQIEGHWRRLERGPIIVGNDAAFWGVFGGTVKATGKSFEMEICNVLHIQDDKIVAWESYGDVSTVAEAWAP